MSRASLSPRRRAARLGAVACGLVLLALPAGCRSPGPAADAPGLRIIWTDVEGGAATLIVTPAGESILVDAGMPGERDPGRIHKTLADVARVERIDHMIVTHFDIDHFGGVADVARKVPIARYWDPGMPDEHLKRFPERRAEFEAASAGKRTVIRPGDSIPLLSSPGGAPSPKLDVLVAAQVFVAPPEGAAAAANAACADHAPKAKDTTENANSIAFVLSLGDFRFFDGGDLTWNLEHELVCPVNLAGTVDVFQSDHHGLDVSNNPVLVRSLEPRVAVVNNGPRKGNEPGTFKTLRETPSIEAIYQLHRNVRTGEAGNTDPAMTANRDETCSAEVVILEVAADGGSYTVSVPSTGHSRRFETRRR